MDWARCWVALLLPLILASCADDEEGAPEASPSSKGGEDTGKGAQAGYENLTCDEIEDEARATRKNAETCEAGDTCVVVDMYELIGENNCLCSFQCAGIVNAASVDALQREGRALAEEMGRCSVCCMADCAFPEESMVPACNVEKGGCELVPDCPAAVTEKCDELAYWRDGFRHLVSASYFGKDLSFVGASHRSGAVLARRTGDGGAFPVVILANWHRFDPENGMAPSARVFDAPSETGLDALAVLSSIEAEAADEDDRFPEIIENEVIILACQETGCALYAPRLVDTDLGTIRFEPVPGGEVPLDEVRGAFANEMFSADEEICVFGDGIACFDGAAWDTWIYPDSGYLINDVAGFGGEDDPRYLAVGDQGTLVMSWPRESAYSELEFQTTGNLLQVGGVFWGFVAAAGEEGLILHGKEEIDRYGLTECTLTDEDIPVVAVSDTDAVLFITASGKAIDMYRAEDGLLKACRQEPVLQGAPLSITELGGIDVVYALALTTTDIYKRYENGGGL